MRQGQTVTTRPSGDTDPGAQITLTVHHLEELIKELLPTAEKVIAGLIKIGKPSADVVWERCITCVPGYEAHVECYWNRCAVTIRRC